MDDNDSYFTGETIDRMEDANMNNYSFAHPKDENDSTVSISSSKNARFHG